MEVRNKIFNNEKIEVLTPNKPIIIDKILDIIDAHQQPTEIAQPGSTVTLKLEHKYSPNDLIRRVSNPKDERPTSNIQRSTAN